MLEARKHKEDPAQSQQRLEKLAAQDPLKFEKDKIKGAIRTDFILSAEIVAIKRQLAFVLTLELFEFLRVCTFYPAGSGNVD